MYLNDVRPNDLTLPSPILDRPIAQSAEKCMPNLLFGHDRCQIEPLHVPVEQVCNLCYIALLHLTQPCEGSNGGQLIQTDHARYGLIPGDGSEVHFNKLWHVERTVVISS